MDTVEFFHGHPQEKPGRLGTASVGLRGTQPQAVPFPREPPMSRSSSLTSNSIDRRDSARLREWHNLSISIYTPVFARPCKTRIIDGTIKSSFFPRFFATHILRW